MNDANRTRAIRQGNPADSAGITPEMLTLIELDQQQIDLIVRTVPGGARNVQDIYPLSPAQEGVLFHSLLNPQGDAYVLSTLLELQSDVQIEPLIAAVQSVIHHHDVLRSAILWEQLPRPLQVVYRDAVLPVEEVALDDHLDPIEQLEAHMTLDRRIFDLHRAPLVRLEIARSKSSRCYALLHLHHLACDDLSWRAALSELMICLARRERELPQPVPYRSYVAEALAHAQSEQAEAYFRSTLGDIEEPTAPFELLDVHRDGRDARQASEVVDPELAKLVRAQARRLGVSPARLFHAGWGLVVAHTSGRDDVVYGTVLFTARQTARSGQRMLGISINTLPLRLRLQDLSAAELVKQTDLALTGLLQYRHVSLTSVQQCSGVTGSMPLFTALLNYRHRESELGLGSADPSLPRVLAQRGARTNYPITISVDDMGDGFVMVAQTQPRIDPRRVTGYLRTAMQSLLEALQHAPETAALSLNILPADERRSLLDAFNATHAPYPKNRSVHELFEEQVRHTPDAIAAICEEQSLTYSQLNTRANQLARHLRALGLQTGEYVPVHMSRSMPMLIAQLAVLKSGAVYVPLDPEMPAERRAFILRDCAATKVIADCAPPADLVIGPVRWIDCQNAVAAIAGHAGADLLLQLDPLPAAYVMYTSGSTGVPKGVVVPHHAVNRLVFNNGYAPIEAQDCLAHYSNPTFDASTLEIWGALLSGARVLIVPQSVVLEVAEFTDLLKRHRVTVLYMSVGLFNQYVDASTDLFAQLRYLIVGGDSLQPEPLRRVLDGKPPRHLLNGYGPTECTTFTTTHPIDAVEPGARSIPIGRPIANAQAYVLDQRRQLVPLEVTGELYIGGAGVACGYLNRPELTAERFVAHPFADDPRARLYKTGDLVRWRAEGVLEFLGRNDQQVKIRGFRVELGEIEARLHQHERIQDAVVVAREDEPGEKRLVAYVVPDASAVSVALPSIEDLRSYVGDALPEYMVPSAIVLLDRLPLTRNGKVDRRALPAPQATAYATRRYEEPRGQTEQILAAIWQELLRVERVGRHDHFFELGGHSLVATRTVARIKDAFSIDMPIALLFECPLLETLSVRVDALRRARILDKIANGGAETSELLERVAQMTDNQVQVLLNELTMEARP